MTLVTARTGTAGQLAAIVLLLLIAAPWTAPFATMQGRFDASSVAAGTSDVVESPQDETTELKALAHPAITAAVAAAPLIARRLVAGCGVATRWLLLASSSTNHAQTLQVLRL
jgi:hypothetical protein